MWKLWNKVSLFLSWLEFYCRYIEVFNLLFCLHLRSYRKCLHLIGHLFKFLLGFICWENLWGILLVLIFLVLLWGEWFGVRKIRSLILVILFVFFTFTVWSIRLLSIPLLLLQIFLLLYFQLLSHCYVISISSSSWSSNNSEL